MPSGMWSSIYRASGPTPLGPLRLRRNALPTREDTGGSTTPCLAGQVEVASTCISRRLTQTTALGLTIPAARLTILIHQRMRAVRSISSAACKAPPVLH